MTPNLPKPQVPPGGDIGHPWTSLLEVIPQGVLLVDAGGRYLEVNPAATRILGLDRATLLAWSLPEPWSHGLAADGSALEKEDCPGLLTLETGLPVRGRVLRWNREDGSSRWLEVSAEALQGGGALLLVTDITEPVGQARKLERLTELYAALSQVNQAIVWSGQRDELLDKICSVMVEFGKFAMAWIGWSDPDTQEVKVLSRCGDQHGYLDSLLVRSDDTPLGRGGTGTAIREGHAVVVDDFLGSSASSPWHEAAKRSGFAASAAIPIRLHGQVRGALMVYATEKNYFGEQELNLLLEAAGDISFALDHLELASQRRRAETALQEQEERYRAFFDHGPDGVVVLDPATRRPLEFNDQACRQLGYTREEFRTLSLADIEAMETPEETARTIQGVLETGFGAFETRHRTKQGELREVQVKAQTLEIGGARAYHCVWRDITEQKRARLELTQSERRYRALFENMTAGFVLFEVVQDDLGVPVDLVILDANKVFGKTTGLEPRDVVGKRLTQVLPGIEKDEADWIGTYGKVALTGESVHLEQGSELLGVFYSVNAYQAEAKQCAVTFDDITARRLAESEKLKLYYQLSQSQKMESLGVLAGGVAHDMNNVLGAILGLASANVELQPLGSPGHAAFSTIIQAAERGGKMVKSLLGFARQALPEEKALDLNALLQEEKQILERTTLARIRLELDLAPDLPPILGDGSVLSHAFMNLCVNAVDAMPEGGTLTLRSRRADSAWVEVLVEDTGLGMPKEIVDKALNPFFTTKGVGKGTGLGLTMVYSAVKAHRGELEIQSEPGKGTCIRMRFPVAEPGHDGLEAVAAPRSEGSQGALQVLLVDDDELIQRSTRMLLGVLGHGVTTAASGEEALALLEGGLNPDVVILDMNMPGLGGAGTLPRLRVLKPTVPVLLATGRVDDAALGLVAAHPRVTLLSKPYGLGEIKQHLGADLSHE